MTTEDTSTTVDESTEPTAEDSGTTTKQRTVAEILALGTFQGCTDEEIQSVIDFKVEDARNDTESKARQAAVIESMNETTEKWNQAAEEANDILKQLLAADLNLGKIDENGEVVSE